MRVCAGAAAIASTHLPCRKCIRQLKTMRNQQATVEFWAMQSISTQLLGSTGLPICSRKGITSSRIMACRARHNVVVFTIPHLALESLRFLAVLYGSQWACGLERLCHLTQSGRSNLREHLFIFSCGSFQACMHCNVLPAHHSTVAVLDPTGVIISHLQRT